MNNSHFSNVVDPRYSSSSSTAPQQQFTQSVSQFLIKSNNQSQFVQQQPAVQQPEPSYGQYNQQFVTSVVYQSPAQTNTYAASLNYGNQSNPLNSQYVSDNTNIQDVIESVKRSAAVRQSQQQQQQSQIQQPQVIEPQKFGNSTLVSSQYVPYDSNLSASFNPNKQQQTLQQPQQYAGYLSQSQSGFVNSTNLSVPQFSGAGMSYYQTPDRSAQIKQDATNIKFLTPNKSPSTCKIVQRSPTKQQIEREIDVQNQIAQQEYLACQMSVNSLKNNIEFINATNNSPDKRHTAKSIVNQMGANIN